MPSFPFLNFSSLYAAFISYIRHVKAKLHITFYNVITSCFEAEKKNQKQPEYAGTGLEIETRRGSVKTNCENLGTFTLTRMFSVSVLLLPPPALFPRMICPLTKRRIFCLFLGGVILQAFFTSKIALQKGGIRDRYPFSNFSSFPQTSKYVFL